MLSITLLFDWNNCHSRQQCLFLHIWWEKYFGGGLMYICLTLVMLTTFLYVTGQLEFLFWITCSNHLPIFLLYYGFLINLQGFFIYSEYCSIIILYIPISSSTISCLPTCVYCHPRVFSFEIIKWLVFHE